MKKTNIRINNFYIIFKDNKYYLTDIDVLDEFKKISYNDLEKYLENDITKQLNDYIKKEGVESKVNFIDVKFKLKKDNKKNIVLSKKGGK